MKKRLRPIAIAIFCFTLVVLYAAKSKDEAIVTKAFSGVTKLQINTTSGDCKVIKHNSAKVEVKLTHEYKPAKNFEPVFEQEGEVLKLREHMKGSNSGHSMWVVMVPEDMDVVFKSASGGILLTDITGTIKINTASGNINASGMKLTGSSNFSTASGKSTVALAESPKYNVLVNSSSGAAELNFNGNDITGRIEMKCRPSLGKIECPLRFTEETETEHGGQVYIVKRVSFGDGEPGIKIHTASGKAILKK